MGNNVLENVTIIMGKHEINGDSICSHGVYWVTGDNNAAKYDKIVMVKISNIVLRDHCKSCTCNSDRSMLEILLNGYFSVFVVVTSSEFSNWNGGMVKTYIDSLSLINIHFCKCTFVSNSVTHGLVDFQYDVSCTFETNKHHPRLEIHFSETSFLNIHRRDADTSYDLKLLKIRAASKCLYVKIKIILNNIEFYNNGLALLEVLQHSQDQTSIIQVYTEGNFIADTNKNVYNADGKLTSF